MLQILFALLSGILTIAAPCILPMLPILLGASVGHNSRQRPWLIVSGFIVSFAAASLVISVAIEHLGLSPDILRNTAVVLLAIFGILMVWPKPFEILTAKFSGAINKANQIGKGDGNWSALILGLVLGIIWTPCAGPILGAILALIATQGTTARSALLLIAYAVGAGVPMLIIAYGSQWLTTKVRSVARYSQRIEQVFGVLVILLAAAMFLQYDTKIEAALLTTFPAVNLETDLVTKTGNPIAPITQAPASSSNNTIYNAANGQLPASSDIDFSNYGQAPDFAGISHWLNSGPLTIGQLKGKVVLIDFWTYSCINCIRTLPYVTGWYDKYKDDGLVVVGVHTPEFEFEKVTSNVQNAINQYNIHYPVAQDNDYGTWNNYNNEYWPAEYLINKQGEIVYEHFGEGNYNHTENAIRTLLGMSEDPNAKTSSLGNIESPEMYFEPSRLQYLTPGQQPSTQPVSYQLPSSIALNNFALDGTWQFDQDHAQLVKPGGKIELHFSSGKVFMVAAADHPITLKITVDGKPQTDVTVTTSKLYTLFDSSDYSEHTIEIDIPDAGFQAFTFTFG